MRLVLPVTPLSESGCPGEPETSETGDPGQRFAREYLFSQLPRVLGVAHRDPRALAHVCIQWRGLLPLACKRRAVCSDTLEGRVGGHCGAHEGTFQGGIQLNDFHPSSPARPSPRHCHCFTELGAFPKMNHGERLSSRIRKQVPRGPAAPAGGPAHPQAHAPPAAPLCSYRVY